MASILQHESAAAASIEGRVRRYAPAIAAAVAAIGVLALYADTVASIVAIWNRSETFAHGYVVAPIALWLAWRRRQRIAGRAARPWFPALLAVAAAGCLWLVMSVAEVAAGRQFALVFMLQAAIVAVVGTTVARAAALPLLFLLFAVPAGEFLLPTLIDHTADFTVAALRASGVPVFRESNHFVIPSGSWSVVEACSGLRYLIASLMVGVMYASVAYHTTWRRIAFVAASIVVPIVGNWLRAYMIVMIGHLSDNRLAVGVDHLIYGWLFFGVLMVLLFWLGSLWSEPSAVPGNSSPPSPAVSDARGSSRYFVVAIAAIALAGLWRPSLALIEQQDSRVVPQLVALRGTAGFEPAAVGEAGWTPAYEGESATLRQTFVRNGAASTLFVAYYRNQQQGRELVTSANQLVSSRDQLWREVERRMTTLPANGKRVDAIRSVVVGPRERLVTYRTYWISGTLTTSDYEAKALLAWSKLRGQGDDAALIVFHGPDREDRDPAREAFEALFADVVRMLEATRATR